MCLTWSCFLNSNPVPPPLRPWRLHCTNLCVSVGMNSIFAAASLSVSHVSVTAKMSISALWMYSSKAAVFDFTARTLAVHKVRRGECFPRSGTNGVRSTTMRPLLLLVGMNIWGSFRRIMQIDRFCRMKSIRVNQKSRKLIRLPWALSKICHNTRNRSFLFRTSSASTARRFHPSNPILD